MFFSFLQYIRLNKANRIQNSRLDSPIKLREFFLSKAKEFFKFSTFFSIDKKIEKVFELGI